MNTKIVLNEAVNNWNLYFECVLTTEFNSRSLVRLLSTNSTEKMDLYEFYTQAANLAGLSVTCTHRTFDNTRLRDRYKASDDHQGESLDIKFLNPQTVNLFLRACEQSRFPSELVYRVSYPPHEGVGRVLLNLSTNRHLYHLNLDPKSSAGETSENKKKLLSQYQEALVIHVRQILTSKSGTLPLKVLYALQNTAYLMLAEPWHDEIARLHSEYSAHPKADPNLKAKFAHFKSFWPLRVRPEMFYDPRLMPSIFNNLKIKSAPENVKRLVEIQNELDVMFDFLSEDAFGTLRSMMHKKPAASLFKKILWTLQNVEDKERLHQVLIPYVKDHLDKKWPASYRVIDSFKKYDRDVYSPLAKVWSITEKSIWKAACEGELGDIQYLRLSVVPEVNYKVQPKPNVFDSIEGMYIGYSFDVGVLETLRGHLPNLKHVLFLPNQQTYVGKRTLKTRTEDYTHVLQDISLETTGTIANHINSVLGRT